MSEFVVETMQLTKRFGEQIAVNNVDIHIRQGKVYGLVGRNGSGKTTIMRMIVGLTKITSGEINICGQRLYGNQNDIYPRIGCMIESPGFYPNLTAAENLGVFAKLRGTISKDAIKNALDVVGLHFDDQKTFSKFSLGMKQRLGIACAIMHDPEILILDEPTNGLDPIGIAEMRGFLKRLSIEQGKTVLISSHILSEIELLADDIGIIHNGVLLEESSYFELAKRNQQYVRLKVSSASKAAYILEQKISITNYTIDDDNTIRIYDMGIDIATVNKTLMLCDVDVVGIHVQTDSLEDYFKKLTGGGEIA